MVRELQSERRANTLHRFESNISTQSQCKILTYLQSQADSLLIEISVLHNFCEGRKEFSMLICTNSNSCILDFELYFLFLCLAFNYDFHISLECVFQPIRNKINKDLLHSIDINYEVVREKVIFILHELVTQHNVFRLGFKIQNAKYVLNDLNDVSFLDVKDEVLSFNLRKVKNVIYQIKQQIGRGFSSQKKLSRSIILYLVVQELKR